MAELGINELDIIFDSTYDGMVAVNNDGIVTLFNKAAERITGLRVREVLRQPAVRFIPNIRLHIVLAEGAAEIGQEQHLENTVVITNRVPIRDVQSEVRGAFAIFRGITEMNPLPRTKVQGEGSFNENR